LASSPRREMYTLYAAMFLIMAGFGIILPTLPFYARRMGASSVEMGLIVTLYAMFQFLSAPFWGNLSDRIGRRPLIAFGMAGYGVSFFLMGASTTVGGLLLARAMGGLVSGSTFPSIYAAVADLTPDESRSAAMGSMGAALNLGFICGPAIGGALAPLGPVFTFYLAGALVVVTAGIACLLLPPMRSGRKAGGAREGGLRAMPVAARSSIAPLFWAMLSVTMGNSSSFSMLSFYMMDRIAASPSDTGIVFTAMGASSAVAQAVLLGRMTKALGDRRVALVGLLLGIAGYGGVLASSNLATLVASTSATGAGIGLVRPTVTSRLSKSTPFPQGLTMGMQSSFESFGRTVGPLLAGAAYGFSIFAPYAIALLSLLAAVPLAGSARRGRAPRMMAEPARCGRTGDGKG